MKKPIVLIVVLVLILIAAFLVLKRGKTSEIETAEPVQETQVKNEKTVKVPLDVSLRYIQGVDGMGSLLKIRLFSRSLLQQDIDNKVLHKGEEKEIKPLVVACPENFWSEAVAFFSSEKDAEQTGGGRIDADIRLVYVPEETQWTFTPGKTYEALYQLSSSTAFPPENRIWAELYLEDQTIRSNDASASREPGDEKGRLIQKARLLINLGKESELLEIAEELISAFPNDSSGYWFKGMALESSGDDSSALAAYEEALKKFPPPGQEGNVEPPLLLIEKIRQLKGK